MSAARRFPALFALGMVVVSSGCAFVPRGEYLACQSRCRSALAENHALAAEVQNLRASREELTKKLDRTEKELALVRDQYGLDRQRLANFQEERDELSQHVDALVRGWHGVPEAVSERLLEVARRHPELQFDPRAGYGKLDQDLLFDSGRTELKPKAQDLLQRVATILNSPEGQDLRVLIVGHTDNQRIADKGVHDLYPTNWHLGCARSLVVLEQLKRLGVEEGRMAQAGFGAYQPVAPNDAPSERQKNRRAEIFLLGPTTPMVGWTETIPQLY